MTSSPAIYVGIRRCAQTLTALVFCLLPWLNAPGAHQFTLISGSLFALDLGGLPFADPVAALQVAVGGFAPAPRLLLGAVLSLGLALLLGRVFCSWICPYGFFSELVSSLRQRAAGVPGGHEESDSRQRDRRDAAFRGRAGIVLLGLVGAAVLGFPLLSLLSMPGELSLVPLLARQEAAGGRADSAFRPGPARGGACAGGARRQTVLVPLCLPPVRAAGSGRALSVARRAGTARDLAGFGLHLQGRDALPRGLFSGAQSAPAAGPPRRDCVMCGDCLKACAARGGALRWSLRAASRRRVERRRRERRVTDFFSRRCALSASLFAWKGTYKE